jgi:hypothetical protein
LTTIIDHRQDHCRLPIRDRRLLDSHAPTSFTDPPPGGWRLDTDPSAFAYSPARSIKVF